MNDQTKITSVAPYAGLAGVIAEIIAPAADTIASGLVFVFTKLANLNTRSERTL